MPIGREMDVEQIRTAALTNVLDGLSAGMFLIAGDGTVMHANSAGQGMLVAEDCDMNAQVQQALTAAVQAGLGVDNLTLPVTAGNGDRYLIHVLPLSSGARRNAPVAHPTCAAVFVQKAVLDGLAPQVMARAFDLTPTELRVLLAIIEVGGIPQAASMLGVADSTVKTHVGRLFEKTGTCRQADLVKLAAGYCTPLLN